MNVYHFNLAKLNERVAQISNQEDCIRDILEQGRLLLCFFETVDVRNSEIYLFGQEAENKFAWGFFGGVIKSSLCISLCSLIRQGMCLLEVMNGSISLRKRFEDPHYHGRALKFITGLLMQVAYVENIYLSMDENQEISLEQFKEQLLYNYNALGQIIPYSQRNRIKVRLWEDRDHEVKASLVAVPKLRDLYGGLFGRHSDIFKRECHKQLQDSVNRYDEIVIDK